ncbi:MAG: S8 family serine peptidase [Bacteriovoracaceae bacterium]|nr:S8 family serine peptidase [Bacteriovoracaceae bacterium]
MKKLLLIASLLSTVLSTSHAQDIVDTFFEKQWGLSNTGQNLQRSTGDLTRIQIPGIPGSDINWDLLEGRTFNQDREVIVAVIDSGLDINHPDLEGRVWSNPVCENLSEEEKLKKPCNGRNFLAKSEELIGDVKDDTGHGTHVSGIIAANINGTGAVGVAVKNVKIMPLKVLSKETTNFVYNNRLITDIVADAMAFAVQNKANVINLSMGWPKLIETPRMKRALGLAQKAGIPIIAAAGNNNKDVPTYPCTNRGVICVGSIDNQGKLSEFSNYGGKIDILAPGEHIVSLYPTAKESRSLRVGGYEVKKGTSQASPFVAAIAATIKLVHPDSSLDEIKARLLNSSKGSQKAEMGRKKSKYGLVDMKKALDEVPEVFVSPDYKGILEIKYNVTGRTSFVLPIKNFLEEVEGLTVKLSLASEVLELRKDTFELDLKKGQTLPLQVQAKIKNKSLDSHTQLKVTIIKDEKVIHESQTALVISGSLAGRKSIKKVPLTGINPKLVSLFKGGKKYSRLKQVSDRFSRSGAIEYYYMNPKLQTEDKDVMSLIRVFEGKFETVDLGVSKANKILSIFKADINLDGKEDYVVYTLGKERINMFLTYLTNEGKPLFGDKSEWKFPITTFEGLPLKNGFEQTFSWLKIKTKEFGSILTPSLTREWLLPEDDNSDDILDRLPNGKAARLYYLLPEVKDGKVETAVRTVNNFDFDSEIRSRFRVRPEETFSLQNPYKQTAEEAAKGKVKTVLAVGREFKKRYFQVVFTDNKTYTINPINNGISYLEDNTIFPIFGLEDKGNPNGEATFMVLNDRSSARLSIINDSGETNRIEKKTNWTDPIFNYIGAYKDKKETTFFLESRYNVHAFDSNGAKYTLPINRDSSFPGVKFAETMSGVIVKGKDTNLLPGVFVNSTLVFGDRLYTMVKDTEGFKRPVELSVTIPKECINLAPARLGASGASHYVFLCAEGRRGVSFRFLPLAL